ncbi:MAG: zinc-dependent peptidase [Bacteroidales bacterium]|nr:zinc-dependent peptidase [Bacteroidales bacterium]
MKIFVLIAVSFILLALVFLPSKIRKHRERKILSTPFPEQWRTLLKQHVGWYHLLTQEEQGRFEMQVQRFLANTQIIGIKTEIDDLLRILTAASAIIPVFNFKGLNFRKLSQVFIVDGNVISKEKMDGYILGQVKVMHNSGIMTLSKQALLQGFMNMTDKKNVGIHEFAHVIDGADGVIDGVPSAAIPVDLIDSWNKIISEKTAGIMDGDSDINAYAATSEAEFFAVVTEYFFERPQIMKTKHPRLYEILSKIYLQDHSNKAHILKSFIKRKTTVVHRNSLCPCGSQKKFKHCCLNKS